MVGLKAGNLDTINAPLHVAAGDFVAMDNATRDRGGEWRKRNGLTSLGTSFSGYSRIASVGTDLCAIADDGSFRSLGANGLVSQQIRSPGQLYNATVDRLLPASKSLTGTACGGAGAIHMMGAWSNDSAAAGAFAAIEDVSTSMQDIGFSARASDVYSYTSALVNLKIIVTTTYIIALSIPIASPTNLVANVYNRTTRASVTSGTLHTDVLSGRFDVIASSSKADRFVVAYQRTSSNGIRVTEFNAATLAVTLGPTADATNVLALGLSRGHNEADGFYWLATADAANGVRKKTFTTAALTAAGAWTVVDAGKLAVTNVALQGAGAYCAYDNTASSVTTVYQDAVALAKSAYLASQYIEANSIMVLSPNAVQPAYYIMRIGFSLNPVAAARIMGGSAPTVAVGNSMLPDFWSPASGQFVGTLLYQSALGFLAAARVSLDRRALTAVRNRVPVASGSDLYVPMGPLLQYDGTRFADAGPMSPTNAPALTAGSAGSLTASSEYSYYTVLCRVDATGKLWRAPPSPVATVTVGATTPSVSVVDDGSWTSYTTRDLQNINGLAREFYLEIYRINPGTTTPRLVTRAVPQALGGTTTFVDTLADATVLAGEALYTSSGEKENAFPPSLYALTQWQDRLVGVSCEERSRIWYSKEFVSGIGVGWNSVFTFETLDEYGPYYAVAGMDDKLILFKENAVYVLNGQGPDSTGANAYTAPMRIATNVGTRNPSSVIRIPDGVLFQAQKGIYMVTRGLEVKFIGAPISNYATTGIANPITSAVAVPDRNEVRLTFAAAPGTVVYNWFFDCWSTWYSSSAVAATLRNGVYYQLLASGACKYEDSTTWADDGAFVTLTCTTGWISLAGLQGAMRVYAARVFGERPSASGNHTVRVYVEFDGLVAGPGAENMTSSTISTDAEYQWEARPARQKCSSLRLTITDLGSTPALETFRLRGIGLLLGVKPGFAKRNPNIMADY